MKNKKKVHFFSCGKEKRCTFAPLNRTGLVA